MQLLKRSHPNVKLFLIKKDLALFGLYILPDHVCNVDFLLSS